MPRKFIVTSTPSPSPSKLPLPPKKWEKKTRAPIIRGIEEGFLATGPYEMNSNRNNRNNSNKTATRHRGLESPPGNKKSNNTAKTNTGRRVPLGKLTNPLTNGDIRDITKQLADIMRRRAQSKPSPSKPPPGNKKRQFKVGAPTESTRVKNLPPFLNWKDPKTGQKYRLYSNNHPVWWLGLENPNPNKTEPNRRKPWFVTNNFVLSNRLGGPWVG